MKFRRKQSEGLVIVEAFQMTRERRFNNAEWPSWLHEAWNRKEGTLGSLYTALGAGDAAGTLLIGTTGGQLLVLWGDWIIRGERDELHLCKPDVFEAHYEPIKINEKEKVMKPKEYQNQEGPALNPAPKPKSPTGLWPSSPRADTLSPILPPAGRQLYDLAVETAKFAETVDGLTVTILHPIMRPILVGEPKEELKQMWPEYFNELGVELLKISKHLNNIHDAIHNVDL